MRTLKNCFFFTLIALSFSLTCQAQNTLPKSNEPKKIVFLGDSLTEGYGVDITSTYTHLLQERFDKDNIHWKVINAGISGSTTASAKGRLKWLLKDKNKPSIIVIALGANDGLRGQKIESIKTNLTEAVDMIKKENIQVIIGEIMVPPNYGKEYSDNFKKIFSQISKEKNITLMPFILKDIAGKPDLNIADGIHPNEKGHRLVYEQVFTFIKPFLN
jgi:acyl-CoA thioesterase-1